MEDVAKWPSALALDISAALRVHSIEWTNEVGFSQSTQSGGLSLPRLPDDIINCAFYLYPDIVTAEDGSDTGGTGSLISREYDSPRLKGRGMLYAISNRHVVEGHGCSVIRLTKADGTPDFIELMPEDWTPHPTADLMAVCLRGRVGPDTHQIKWCEYDRGLVGRDRAKSFDIGIGDDVVMIGRFIGHDGKHVNRPSARFGNISMDVAGIFNPVSGREEQSYAVEMRSKPGYSGSPVMIMGSPGFIPNPELLRRFFLLLGVDWGQITERHPVLDAAGKPVQTGQHFMADTGMNGVVPAWFIKELLGTGKLDDEFKALEKIALKEVSGHRSAVIPQSAPSPSAAPAPIPEGDRSRFNRLLGAAVKTPKPSDET